METFLEGHEPEENLESLRQRVSDGEKLSDVVKRDRDERL